jgi:hypothetical protein
MMSLQKKLITFQYLVVTVSAFQNLNSVTRTVKASQRSMAVRLMTDAELTSLVSSSPTVMREFEPQISAETVTSMVLITLLCAVAAAYWWNVVIPDRRAELAMSKRKGEVKEYLDDLREAEVLGERQAERWLFADWLRNREAKPGAIPFLKKAKWNSGDNPVLVAFAGIMSFVIAASVLERFH